MKKTTQKTILFMPIVVIVIAIGAILWFTNWLDASAGCKPSLERLAKMNTEQISLRNDAGRVIKITAYIADDNNKRAEGYQHICEDIINTTQMLFVYRQPIGGRFHMQNVQAPLDIGFFDSTGRLLSTMVMDTYADGNSRLYDPGQQFQYALEASVGFFNEHKLSVGKSRLILSSVDGL